jgi:hypothetical protein
VEEGLYRYGDLRSGGMSREQIRQRIDDGTLRRVERGVYADADGDETTRLRALFLRMPDGLLLSHRSAAHLLGFGEKPADGVHVMVPTGLPRPQIDGVITHEAVLPARDSLVIAGVPCVSPQRAAIDLARTSGRLDAIATLDAALRSNACDRDALLDEAAMHRGLRNVCQARQLIPLADARAECPQESHLRLVIIDAGLPAPEPQLWISDSAGRGIYRIDLAYAPKRVGLEYDGASHLERERLRGDRYRMNWLASRGWTMRYFTDEDLYRRRFHLLDVVRAALAPTRRSWTLGGQQNTT